jgi:hypothetical protein
MIRVHGSILQGLHAAAEGLHFNSPAVFAAPSAYRSDQWYQGSELDRFVAAFSSFEHCGPVLQRIGEELMRAWYLHGPGQELAPGAVDFLRFQASSDGYRSVVQGPQEAVGEFKLGAIDENCGTAIVRSTTIFDPDLEIGILRGGMDAAGGFLYSAVRLLPDRETYELHFMTPRNLKSVQWAPPRSEAYWEARYQSERAAVRADFERARCLQLQVGRQG